MSQSLNQITDAILGFAESHGQIQTARFSAPYDWMADTDNRYPSLCFDLLSVRSVPNQLAYTFEMYVASRAADGYESEVLSDTILIAHDVLAWMGDQEFVMDGEAQMTPFVNGTADVLAGVRMEFTLRATAPLDRCAIPYKPEDAIEYLLLESGDFILQESGDKITLN